MGSGKTTVGALLARRLGYTFVDMDARIALEAGKSIPELFELEGELGFRRREGALLQKLAAEKNIVVSTGGGVVVRASSRRLLRKQFRVFWLMVGAAEAWRRIGTGRGRPVLSLPIEGARPGVREPKNRLVDLARIRRPLYAEVGQGIRTGGKTPGELAELIAERLGC